MEAKQVRITIFVDCNNQNMCSDICTGNDSDQFCQLFGEELTRTENMEPLRCTKCKEAEINEERT